MRCSLGGGGGGVCGLELFHESDQSVDTFDRHSVVERCAASTNRAMSLKVDEVGGGGLSNELGLEGVVGADAERNVDVGSESGLHIVAVVAFGGGDVVVQKLRSLSSLGLHSGDTTLLEHVCDVKTAHVDGPA